MKNFEIITKIQVYQLESCTDWMKNLIQEAKKIASNAYAPYSNYNVGAAVLLNNDIIVTGSNQENAAYPSGLCAERTALFYANAQYPDVPVKAIAIAAGPNGIFSDEVCTPCGSCRQVINEVENRYDQPIQIIMYGEKQIYVVNSIKDLLPLSFGKDSLG